MKAVVKTDSGMDHMEYMDIPTPEATGDLVQIKIAYSGICGTDLHAFKGTYASTKPPVVLGHEFSGVVTAVGPEVRRVKVGDRVTSETTFQTCGACPMCKSKDYNLCGNRRGIGTQVNGSMAEYLVSREESVHVLPDNVSLLSAALTEPLACMRPLKKARCSPEIFALYLAQAPSGRWLGRLQRAKGQRSLWRA